MQTKLCCVRGISTLELSLGVWGKFAAMGCSDSRAVAVKKPTQNGASNKHSSEKVLRNSSGTVLRNEVRKVKRLTTISVISIYYNKISHFVKRHNNVKYGDLYPQK